MTFYGRERRRPRDEEPASAHYRRRRARRAERAPDPAAAGFTLERVADPEGLIAIFERLAATGGLAPGLDGVTYRDFGRSEICDCLRAVSKMILDGTYRPGKSRILKIPKPGTNKWRRLALRGIIDRVVSARLNQVLSPLWEGMFSPMSYGFRPGRSTWDLLADLEVAAIVLGLYVLAQDDAANAFPNVNIPDTLEDHHRHIKDPKLLKLIEAVLRGGEDRGRTVGIAQGDPYSPTALNVRLHVAHDTPFAGDRNYRFWLRYADNLVYLCRTVQEGHETIAQAGQLLASAGLSLKGEDGPPVDLRTGEAQLLGFALSIEGNRLRLRPGTKAWGKLIDHLKGAHKLPNPPEGALSATLGWVAEYGPAFETHEQAATLDRILRIAAEHGFRELPSRKILAGMQAAHRRWQAYREEAWRAHGGPPTGSNPSSTSSSCCSARSAPTVNPDDSVTGIVRGQSAREGIVHAANDPGQPTGPAAQTDPDPGESRAESTSEPTTRRAGSPRAVGSASPSRILVGSGSSRPWERRVTNRRAPAGARTGHTPRTCPRSSSPASCGGMVSTGVSPHLEVSRRATRGPGSAEPNGMCRGP